MVKKIKRFVVLCLWSFLLSLISGKVNYPVFKDKACENKSETESLAWNSAEASLGYCEYNESY